MSNIEFLGNLVAIERSQGSKSSTRSEALFVDTPAISDAYGTVMYIGKACEESGKLPFSVGDQVYFGPNRSELRIAGKDLLVMEVSNVWAVVSNKK